MKKKQFEIVKEEPSRKIKRYDYDEFQYCQHLVKYPWRKMKLGDSFTVNFKSKEDRKKRSSYIQNAGRLFCNYHKRPDIHVAMRKINERQVKIYFTKRQHKVNYSWKDMKIGDYFTVTFKDETERKRRQNTIRLTGAKYYKNRKVNANVSYKVLKANQILLTIVGK